MALGRWSVQLLRTFPITGWLCGPLNPIIGWPFLSRNGVCPWVCLPLETELPEARYHASFIPASHLLFGISSSPALERVPSSLHLPCYHRNRHVCATWPHPWTLLIGSGVRPSPRWANESLWEFGSRFKGSGPLAQHGYSREC